MTRHYETADLTRDGVDGLKLLLGAHGDAGLGQHLAENLQRDLRLEIVAAARLGILRVVEGDDLRRIRAVGLRVEIEHALEKLGREPTDGFAFADIRFVETAAHQAAD